MKTSRIWLVPTLAVMLAVLWVAAAGAQEGTINLAPAQIWADDEIGWNFQLRDFDKLNMANWELGIRGRVGERTEAGLSYLAINPTGCNPFPEMLPEEISVSDWRILVLSLKQHLLGNTDRGMVSLIFNAEWGVKPLSAEIDYYGVRVGDYWGGNRLFEFQNLVLSWALPIQWGEGKTVWLIEPKLAGFDSQLDVFGGQQDFLGVISAIGGGVVQYLSPNVALMADATAILGGYNTADKHTAEMKRKVAWGGGVRWNINDDKMQILDLFATNAVGSSTATSLLVLPGNEVAWGLRYGMQF